MSEKSKRRAEIEAAERELFRLQNGGGAEDQPGRGILLYRPERMRNIRWFVKRTTHRPELPKGRMAERSFAFRKRWIFSPVGILAESS